MKTYFISCDYNEFDPGSYRGVEIYADGRRIHKIYDNGFDDDFEAALEYIKKLDNDAVVLTSSSVDNFIIDRACQAGANDRACQAGANDRACQAGDGDK